MKISFYDTHAFEKSNFENLFKTHNYRFDFHYTRLTEKTAELAKGADCVCVFVNDALNATVLEKLKLGGVKLIALRSAGYNHVDLAAAKKLSLKVVRVPEYSPYAVAEHAVALLLTLNRKTHKAYNRTRENNFSLDGLVGFDLHEKTIGLVGLGRIGSVMAHIMKGFGCKVLGYDQIQNPELVRLGVEYVDLQTVLKNSDVISLHVPLNKETLHIINTNTLALTKPGVILINTSRGGLIETKALIKFLKNSHIGAAGLDVYEEEADIFFQDHSEHILQDDVLSRLMTFPNTLITSHQGFLTAEALKNIADTTLENINDYSVSADSNTILKNEVLN